MSAANEYRHRALGLLRDEHRSLAAVVHALQFLARRIGKGEAPDMKLLGAISHYLTQFPERLHHPAEDRWLFEPLRHKTEECADEIATLAAEHARGEERSAALNAAVSELAAGIPGAGDRFVRFADQYADFYWSHMMREETLIVPLAERTLDEAEWEAAVEGFQSNHDPMYGGDTAREFETLFARIVRMAPPPIGLGEPDL